jgi:hypothetical protein
VFSESAWQALPALQMQPDVMKREKVYISSSACFCRQIFLATKLFNIYPLTIG